MRLTLLCLLLCISCIDVVRDPHGYKHLDAASLSKPAERTRYEKLADRLFRKGDELMSDGDYQRAAQYFADALHIGSALHGAGGRGNVRYLVALAELYSHLDNPIYAKGFTIRAHEILRQQPEDERSAEVLLSLSRLYSWMGYSDSALECLRLAQPAALLAGKQQRELTRVINAEIAINEYDLGRAQDIEPSLNSALQEISASNKNHYASLRRIYSAVAALLREKGRSTELASALDKLKNQLYPNYDCLLLDLEIELLQTYLKQDEKERFAQLLAEIRARFDEDGLYDDEAVSRRHNEVCMTKQTRLFANEEVPVNLCVDRWSRRIPGTMLSYHAKQICFDRKAGLRLASLIAQASEKEGAFIEALTYYKSIMRSLTKMPPRDRIRYLSLFIDTAFRIASILTREDKLSGPQMNVWYQTLSAYEQQIKFYSLRHSEKEFYNFISTFVARQGQLMSLLHDMKSPDEFPRVAFTAQALHNSRDIDESARRAAIWTQAQVSIELREALERYQFLVAHAVQKEQSVAAEPATATAVPSELEALEDWLQVRLPAARRAAVPEDVSQLLPLLSEALPPEAALITFVHYLYLPSRHASGQPLPEPQARYHAFVLRRGVRLTSVDLGPAEAIDQDVARLRRAICQPGQAECARLASQGLTYEEPAAALRRKLIGPIEAALAGARELLVSADGALHLVPFAVLQEDGLFLTEQFQIRHVSSALDLLARPNRTDSKPSLYVFADPDLRSQVVPLAAASGASTMRGAPLGLSQRAHSCITNLQDLPQLPAARQEAAHIQKLFPAARLFVGESAAEATLRALPLSPGILHLAMHAVICGAEAAVPSDFRLRGASHFTEEPVRLPQNPLLRSGLILAGAGIGQDAPDLDRNFLNDGWITALEVSSLPLSGTQLVVLSACGTARGSVLPGHGVAGLRRAFFAAGAETVVASLWDLEDEVARDFMSAFYAQLKRGKDRAGALREAAAEVRRKKPNPFHWAPFILLGQGGPIRGI